MGNLQLFDHAPKIFLSNLSGFAGLIRVSIVTARKGRVLRVDYADKNETSGMKSRTEPRNLALARLSDAETLFSKGHYDSEYYMSGYVIELRLKARMITTLGWPGFPETHKELPIDIRNVKIHDLVALLHMSGR
jgi:hypothetical protein